MSKTLAVVVIVAAASISSASRPAAQAPSSGDELRTWSEAVAQHRPGDIDAAVTMAARWTAADLERLIPSVLFYLNTVRGEHLIAAGPGPQPSPASCGPCQVSRKERERLIREALPRVGDPERVYIRDLVPRPPKLNAFIVRAIILHSDAAMLFPREPAVPGAAPSPALPRRGGSQPQYSNLLRVPGAVMRSVDGQFVGYASGAPHWYIARALSHFITPEPTSDPDTRRWYLATTAFLAASSDFANLSTHLEAAEALFPNDATVAFDLGWRSEVHATPRLQTHVRALVAAAEETRTGPKGTSGHTYLCILGYIPCDTGNNPFGIKSVRDSLTDAQRYFARAATLDPQMSEAHVRLAHVRTLLGRYPEAEAALKNMPLSGAADVNFYAVLVQGLTFEALNRLDEADAAYEQALALFPHAQSANLAMSVVQQRRGDALRSAEFAKRAIAAPPDAAIGQDPFERYRYGRGRNVKDAWAAVYAALESR